MERIKTVSTLVIIQARMGSSRLYAKMLLPIIGNKGALELMLERVSCARKVDKIIVATTTSPADDLLVEVCRRLGYEYFRGSEDDVLDRYYQAALSFGPAEIIIRLTGDCPVHDPVIIDKVINHFLNSDVDYVCNTEPPTYPDGLDVEVFSFFALEKAWRKAVLKSEREHVTPYIKNHPNMFKLDNVKCEKDLSDKRWTLDEKEDYIFIKNLYENLYKEVCVFGMEETLLFLSKHPELEKINQHIFRNEGYQKSLKEDTTLDSDYME